MLPNEDRQPPEASPECLHDVGEWVYETSTSKAETFRNVAAQWLALEAEDAP